MKTACVLLVLAVACAKASVILKDVFKRDVSDESFSAKLSKIKDLLLQIEAEKSSKMADNKKLTKPPTTPSTDLKDLKEPMADVGVWGEPIDSPRSDSLSRSDIGMLKELKGILKNARRQRTKKLFAGNSGEDLDALGDDAKESSDVLWQDLARQLESDRDQLYLRQQGWASRPTKPPAITSEGYFLPLREEIMAAVEKNLMTDLALAIHDGITVDEIIEDLIRRANARD